MPTPEPDLDRYLDRVEVHRRSIARPDEPLVPVVMAAKLSGYVFALEEALEAATGRDLFHHGTPERDA